MYLFPLCFKNKLKTLTNYLGIACVTYLPTTYEEFVASQTQRWQAEDPNNPRCAACYGPKRNLGLNTFKTTIAKLSKKRLEIIPIGSKPVSVILLPAIVIISNIARNLEPFIFNQSALILICPKNCSFRIALQIGVRND